MTTSAISFCSLGTPSSFARLAALPARKRLPKQSRPATSRPLEQGERCCLNACCSEGSAPHDSFSNFLLPAFSWLVEFSANFVHLLAAQHPTRTVSLSREGVVYALHVQHGGGHKSRVGLPDMDMGGSGDLIASASKPLALCWSPTSPVCHPHPADLPQCQLACLTGQRIGLLLACTLLFVPPPQPPQSIHFSMFRWQ